MRELIQDIEQTDLFHAERTHGESHERAEGMAATSAGGTAPKLVTANALHQTSGKQSEDKKA
jgi:hypothetical protein